MFRIRFARNAIENRQIIPEPLCLVDDQLVLVCPHVVGVIHVDFGQGNPLADLPGVGVHGDRGARLRLVGRLLEFGVYPDLTDACD